MKIWFRSPLNEVFKGVSLSKSVKTVHKNVFKVQLFVFPYGRLQWLCLREKLTCKETLYER